MNFIIIYCNLRNLVLLFSAASVSKAAPTLHLPHQHNDDVTATAKLEDSGALNPLQNTEMIDDIWFTSDEAALVRDELEQDQQFHRKRQKRKAINFKKQSNKMWELPILYKFDGSHSSSQKAVIRKAFKEWEDKTCIRFAEINKIPSNTYLLVTKSLGRGCASWVGKQEDRLGQSINLGSRCLYTAGSSLHEIGHVLGLWHEHQRPDRDQFVNILWNNIFKGYRYHFAKEPATYIDAHGVSYDYTSIMHYSSKAGTNNNLETVQTKNPLHQRSIGQRLALSFLDAKIINLAYCNDSCQTSQLPRPCLHGGYQDPNRCGSCRCPDGFAGAYCEAVAPWSQEPCGGEIVLKSTGDSHVISSPGYTSGKPYQTGQRCHWRVKAPAGYRPALQFLGSFGVVCRVSSKTCYHWVEVKYGKDFSLPGARFCCKDRPSEALEAEGDELIVIFRADYKYSSYVERVGFQARLFVAGKGKTEKPANGFDETTVPTSASTVTSDDTTTSAPSRTETELPVQTTQTAEESTFTSSHTYTEAVTKETNLNTGVDRVTWGPWSICIGHPCKCGCHSYMSREERCITDRCRKNGPRIEKQPCCRACGSKDFIFYYIGRLFKTPCSACAAGYKLEGKWCYAL